MSVKTADRKARRRRNAGLAALVLVLALVCAVGVHRARTAATAATPQGSAAAPVPVSIATAVRRDVPIYLTGLGTVQASRTIAIHAQVDGKLLSVNFTEGQDVRQGDVLARIDPRPFQATLDQAKAKKAQDRAQLVDAQKDLARFKTLAGKNFETQQNVDLQQAKVDQFIATIAADDAAIEGAQTQLDYTTITAPSDGRIGFRHVDAGNIVHASDATPIATLTLTQPSDVVFTLPAKSLDDVRNAMKRGPVEVDAYDQDNRSRIATGTLLLIDNQIDQATATMRLKAQFANKDEALWPGEFVNARLLAETRRGALVVPSAAIRRGPQDLYVWVLAPDDTAHMQAVQTGPSADGVTVVTSGLADGGRVVTDGDYKLQPNARVVIVRSPARGTS